jgi:putative tricarboxylic transport membrane protein
MRRLDYSAAAVMLLFALGVVAATADLEFFSGNAPSSRFMPVAVAGITMALALALFGEARTAPREMPADWPDRLAVRRVGTATLLVLVFVFAASYLGFVLTSAAFVLAMLLGIERRPILPSLLAAGITATIIQVIFDWWLQIPLPKSPLGF